MVNSLPVCILVGLMLGFLTGLGTGGGSLLILWLTLVAGMEPETSRTVNLMFFIPAAVAASLLRCLKGGIPWPKIWLPALAGCIAAGLFSLAGSYYNTKALERIFGILLIYTGTREIFYRPKD